MIDDLSLAGSSTTGGSGKPFHRKPKEPFKLGCPVAVNQTPHFVQPHNESRIVVLIGENLGLNPLYLEFDGIRFVGRL